MHSKIYFIEDIISEVCKYVDDTCNKYLLCQVSKTFKNCIKITKADVITKNYIKCKNIPSFIDVISKQLCNKSKYIKPKLCDFIKIHFCVCTSSNFTIKQLTYTNELIVVYDLFSLLIHLVNHKYSKVLSTFNELKYEKKLSYNVIKFLFHTIYYNSRIFSRYSKETRNIIEIVCNVLIIFISNHHIVYFNEKYNNTIIEYKITSINKINRLIICKIYPKYFLQGLIDIILK